MGIGAPRQPGADQQTHQALILWEKRVFFPTNPTDCEWCKALKIKYFPGYTATEGIGHSPQVILSIWEAGRRWICP